MTPDEPIIKKADATTQSLMAMSRRERRRIGKRNGLVIRGSNKPYVKPRRLTLDEMANLHGRS